MIFSGRTGFALPPPYRRRRHRIVRGCSLSPRLLSAGLKRHPTCQISSPTPFQDIASRRAFRLIVKCARFSRATRRIVIVRSGSHFSARRANVVSGTVHSETSFFVDASRARNRLSVTLYLPFSRQLVVPLVLMSSCPPTLTRTSYIHSNC